MLLKMEESQVGEFGPSSREELRNSKCPELKTVLQHPEANCDSPEDAGALEEEVEDYIARNRKLLGPTFAAQELREETPGSEETRIDPPDGQQDPESEKNKEKTLGMLL